MTRYSYTIDRESPIYIAGHRGLVGSALWRVLQAEGYQNLIGATSSEVDLRDRDQTFAFLEHSRPAVLIDAAARVGGIMANSTRPVDFLNDNLRIQTNLFEAAHSVGVERFLFLGSSCIYPKLAPQPIHEDSLLTGPLEHTNQAYAIAKIAGVLAMEAYREQYGNHWISAMPTNLYGPRDNYDLQSSHVLPALIRKFHEAKVSGSPHVTLWGTGTPLREFLYSDDLARACLVILERYDDPQTINVGIGSDVSIRELAQTVQSVIGYEGEIEWDTSKPDGTPRKLMDSSRLRELGWEPTTQLAEGIALAYQDYLSTLSST